MPAGWRPDSSWPPAPEGWVFWVPEVSGFAGESVARGPVGGYSEPVASTSRGAGAQGLVKRHRMWTAVAALAVVGLVGGSVSAIAGTGNEQVDVAESAPAEDQAAAAPAATTESEGPAVVDVADHVKDKECDAARSILTGSRDKSKAIIKKATAKDAYDAAERVGRYARTPDGDARSTKLTAEVEDAFAAAREQARAAGPVLDERATDQALTGCNLTELNLRAQALTGEADDAVERLRAMAERVPWYPKGFTTYLDDDIAFQWVDNPDCGYLGCFQLRIMTNKSCGSLYVELSTENAAGEKIGFTNDVLSGLSPGDRGLMTFAITNDNARGASFNKMNCY